MAGAAQVGHTGPNVEAMANARGAAYHVYEIMNRVIEPCNFYVLLIFC